MRNCQTAFPGARFSTREAQKENAMIVVTGATGKLGRLVVAQLLEKVPAREIAVAVRDPGKAADLAAKGVEVRRADYAEPASLESAFAGAEKLLLISASEVGKRIAQHAAAIGAAKKAGVKLLVYTSILHADTSRMSLAHEHLETEKAIRASGIPHVLLRNGWYIENYTENLGGALEHGVIGGSAKDGKIAAATRADYAAAAVAVLTAKRAPNEIYELAGDRAFTMSELAAEVARQSGRPVAYNDMPAQEYAQLLAGFGVPKPMADVLADSDVGITRGELDDHSGDLHRLIGRATTPLADVVRSAVAR
jgi:NAD(P)H dehydrogenase (quinone)